MASKRNMRIGEIAIIAVLFALMLLWGPFYQRFLASPPPPVPPATAEAATNAVVALPPAELTAAPPPPEVKPPPPETAAPAHPATEGEPPPSEPERFYDVTSAVARVRLSSRGAAVAGIELLTYPLRDAPDSPPVTLDFHALPALTYGGLPGLGSNTQFDIVLSADAASALCAATTRDGLSFERRLTLRDGYQLVVQDSFSNTTDRPLALPDHALYAGPMRQLEGESAQRGIVPLGIDTLPSAGGERVRHWGKSGFFSRGVALPQMFLEPGQRGGGCSRPRLAKPLPVSIRERDEADVDWVAVKNKFFVQILELKGGADGVELMATRQVPPRESADDPRSWSPAAVLESVAAGLRLEGRVLAPGETLQRDLSFYAGPKKSALIRALGHHREAVMEFGWLRWLCQPLLWTLNGLHAALPNYGLAIILLTILIRVVFWPVTHKSTESMKRMQELQPLIQELKEKYKDKPQKLQQETMALYREHKVNPMSGCLPLLIQFPVLIALFNVLQSAVELRYAGFLWVQDLSAPENLFPGLLPFAINPLPLVMTATQIWQTKLTPSPGDPSQQKMMMLMPVIFLVFFYNMPSALVLYWTANQVMMIVQLLWQRRKQAQAKTLAAKS